MSTLAIVLIAVAVIALLAIIFATVLSPKRRAEKKLGAEREHAASHHREVASERHSRASVADQHAEEARVKAERAQHEADLARQEAFEAETIDAYLPAELGDAEFDGLVREGIAATGASSPRDMGAVMKHVMAASGGRADGKRVSAKVKEALT